MKPNSVLVKAEEKVTPEDDPQWLAPKPCCDRSVRLTELAALIALWLVVTGCQTFNYTDEDLARERRKLAEGYANGGWRGGMGGWGGWGGVKVSPNIGNIQCPGLGLGGVCPGGSPSPWRPASRCSTANLRC
jgi:hypothetical protein